MDFNNELLSCIQTNTALTKNILLNDYLPTPLSPPISVTENLSYVQGYGHIHATYPYYYEIAGLASYCFLYTESGTGAAIVDNCNYILAANTLAIINCQKHHRIEIRQSSWNYVVFFINGPSLSYLFQTLTDCIGPIYEFPAVSGIPGIIRKLYLQLEKHPDKYFLHAKTISDILYDLILDCDNDGHHNIPDYLSDIRHCFDVNYPESFSLDALEKQYHISKYRLCREFTKQYDISPLQYLNQRRIEAAKEALRYTDKRINEIGRMVGFENTNHFIRLFKQQTGVTPLIFRKKTPV